MTGGGSERWPSLVTRILLDVVVGRQQQAAVLQQAEGAARDKGRRDPLIQEENLERAGRTIPPGAFPDTPPHLEEFDRGYIRDYLEEVIMRRPANTHAHPMINYAGKQKLVEEARENNPYE